MENSETNKVLKPKTLYRTYIPVAHKILAIFSGLLILIGIIESIIFFNLNTMESLILTIILLLFYAILLFFLLRQKTIRIVRHRRNLESPAIKTISQQIANEITKPIEVKITEVKPTTTKKEVVTTKTAPVQKYSYIGSTAAKTFHKTSCRLARLIKPKYKIPHNSKSHFETQKYSACKICMPTKAAKKKAATKKKTTKKKKSSK